MAEPAATPTVVEVARLSDLQHGQEAICFAALVKKEGGTDKHGNPFVKCHFRDKRVERVAPLWWSNAYREQAEKWREGIGYRLRVRCSYNLRFGFQLDIVEIREAGEEDAAEGYNYFDLVESSDRDPDEMFNMVKIYVDRYIEQPHLRKLVEMILDEHKSMFMRMPAAQAMHHNYTSGLLEHVWSMTRIAGFLSEHYTRYYTQLNPPLDKGIVVAGAILHDIGKLFELDYHPLEAKYTIKGRLVGHVLMGRDLVRDTARKIDNFPEETLLMLEHAILAHHGKEEFGAPKPPQTLEALMLHYIDDLDSKVNSVARQRINATGEEPFTGRIFAMNNRPFYRGIPVPPMRENEPVEVY